MATSETIRDLLEPLLALEGYELVDAQVGHTLVRILVDREGGIDLEEVARATELVSTALDDADPMPGRYTLEVSSPGIERPLRTVEHFTRHVGSTVSVKTVAGFDGERRFEGVLTGADDDAVTVAIQGDTEIRVAHSEIEKARTVFQWDAAPKLGTTGRQKQPTQKKPAQKNRRQTEKAS